MHLTDRVSGNTQQFVLQTRTSERNTREWSLIYTLNERFHLQWQSCLLCEGCTDGGQRLMKGIWGVEEHDTRGSRFQERRQLTVKNH